MQYLQDPTAILLNCYTAVNQHIESLSYYDRDWNKYTKWMEKQRRELSKEQLKELYDQERRTGIPMGPPDCQVKKTRPYTPYDISVYAMFPQVWESTAMGFGGIGGAAITTAYTVILDVNNTFMVFFGGRFAYKITRPTDKFFEDIAKRHMRHVSNHGVYQKTE